MPVACTKDFQITVTPGSVDQVKFKITFRNNLPSGFGDLSVLYFDNTGCFYRARAAAVWASGTDIEFTLPDDFMDNCFSNPSVKPPMFGEIAYNMTVEVWPGPYGWIHYDYPITETGHSPINSCLYVLDGTGMNKVL